MAPVGSFGPWIVRRTIQGGGRGNAISYEVAKAGSSARFALKTPQRRPPSEPYQRFRDEVDFHRKYQDPGILPMVEGHAPPSLGRGERAWMVMPLATPFQIALADADLRAVVVAIASVAETLSRPLDSAGGNPSTAYHEFAEGETILIVAPGMPSERKIQMNGQACEGRYTIESRVETDVLLHFGAGSCRIEVLGAHAEGSVHTDLPTEPKVDGH